MEMSGECEWKTGPKRAFGHTETERTHANSRVSVCRRGKSHNHTVISIKISL